MTSYDHSSVVQLLSLLVERRVLIGQGMNISDFEKRFRKVWMASLVGNGLRAGIRKIKIHNFTFFIIMPWSIPKYMRNTCI